MKKYSSHSRLAQFFFILLLSAPLHAWADLRVIACFEDFPGGIPLPGSDPISKFSWG